MGRDPVLARSLNYSFQPSASSRSSDLQRRLKLEEYRAQELRYERARQAASVEERLSEFDASPRGGIQEIFGSSLREAEARKKGAVEALRSKRDGEKRVLEDRVIRIPDDTRALKSCLNVANLSKESEMLLKCGCNELVRWRPDFRAFERKNLRGIGREFESPHLSLFWLRRDNPRTRLSS